MLSRDTQLSSPSRSSFKPRVRRWLEIRAATLAASSSTNFEVRIKRENFVRLIKTVYHCCHFCLGGGIYSRPI
jgi:hypothetical protein